jgi:hypothetical protein
MAIETTTKMPTTSFPGGLTGYEGRRPVTTTPTTPVVSTPTIGTDIHTDTDGRKYKWAYESTKGWYKEYVEETPAEKPAEAAAPTQSGSDRTTDPNPAWTNMTDSEKAAYYRENPMMSAITRFGQTALGYTLPGKILGLVQDKFNPGFTTAQSLIAHGIDPTGYSPSQLGKLAAIANEGYAGLGALKVGNTAAQQRIAEAIASRNEMQAPAPVETININTGERTSDYGGWNGTAADNSNRSDPSAVGSMADSRDGPGGDKTGGQIGRKKHHKYPGMEQGLGSAGLETGGFVFPADVISKAGNGSTDAGFEKLSSVLGGLRRINGKGDGMSDSIPTKIDGKQPAAVAKDEGYLTPQQVQRLGGSKRLYAMLDNIRKQAHGTTKQQRPVNVKKALG